ncbi:MAG: nitrate reductase [Planctomycetota bacterium]|nr:MAG: nitrate reductase [Planctomycetota bacterium]
MIEMNSSLYNEDLAPVPWEKRTWGMWDLAALWVGMCVCIPTYMLAADLMKAGMHWWQALLTITLGNVIVLIPMILNGHAGTKYGVSLPVLLRSSFGVKGAHIPAVMRALVACGWFGIQTWIGGSAIYGLVQAVWDLRAYDTGPLPVLGISAFQFLSFLLFWAINMWVILKGIESIRWLEKLAAPFLILVGVALLVWGVWSAGGFGRIFSEETVNMVRGKRSGFHFWSVFFPFLTAMVGFWATVALNIPDFTCHAKSQRDQILGQVIGLPTTMALFSFIGIAVTAATVVIYHEAIWDPVQLLMRFHSPLVVVIALLGLVLATLSTNIAANVVAPANGFSNLAPHRISFRMGGIITGVIGIVMMPWKLLSSLEAYIFTWLIGYSALLGSILGVMLADYYLIRRAKLNLEALYSPDGEYSYGGSGFNFKALFALGVGILINFPGFLHQATGGGISVPRFFQNLYTYAWFVGFFFSGGVYLLLACDRRRGKKV